MPSKKGGSWKASALLLPVTRVSATWLLVPEQVLQELVQPALAPCLEVHTLACPEVVRKALPEDGHRVPGRRKGVERNQGRVAAVACSRVGHHPSVGRYQRKDRKMGR